MTTAPKQIDLGGRFLIALILLTLAAAGVVFGVLQGIDLSRGLVRPPRRTSATRAAVDDVPAAAPMPITLDGVSLHPQPPAQSGGLRLLARTVNFRLSTDFREVQDRLAKWTEAHQVSIIGEEGSTTGGRAASAQVAHSLRVTLAVPIAEAETARASVPELGTVLQQWTSTEDLTDGHRQLLTRLETARAEDRRLTALLAGGTSRVPDAAGVERAQARARTEVQRLTTEDLDLTRRAAVLTIVLMIEGR